MKPQSRRSFLSRCVSLPLLSLTPALAALLSARMNTRTIPSTGEALPMVGLGTWQTFDVGTEDEKIALRNVLTTLTEHGGSVIDSSPMYGRSESVAGELTEQLKISSSVFMATKVWTSGAENGKRQMNESFRLLRRSTLDLLQIHNLVDWRTHLKTLKDWKAEGRIRYIGITHYTESAYPAIEQILRSEEVDFLQINYSLLSRKAADRVLPVAQERKVAVLVNRPFEEGQLFSLVQGKNLPDWASEFDCTSWGQFFLKFILSHPAVTCVIPGTSKPNHMADNAMSGVGRMPTEEHRKKMIELLS